LITHLLLMEMWMFFFLVVISSTWVLMMFVGDVGSDLSVWCFACEHYLDAQVIPQLRPVFDALHLMKFGVPAPPRAEPKIGERRVIVVQTPA
jgi:hypothetical protein